MPTSSQSQILSVVDYQLLQQQPHGQGEAKNLSDRIESKQRQPKDNRHASARKKDGNNRLLPSLNTTTRRRSAGTTPSQRSDLLHMPVINLYSVTHNEKRPSIQSSQYLLNPLNNDNQIPQIDEYPTSIIVDNNDSASSDIENINRERRSSVLNENTRRLLVLGTIRPSKTFYKDLQKDDADHLMEYFHRMRNTNQKITSEEINQELETKCTEYKPKIFYDSTCVTKAKIKDVEKIVEQYANQIRTQQVELVKLDSPMRFIIKQLDNDTPLITIPREYHDCFLTLITRTDPLCQSDLITELIQDKLFEDIITNSLDISYFPGGMNYEISHEEIDKNGQMTIETYKKLKKRLNNRKVWYFNGPPEKKANALLAILPLDSSIKINHQYLLDCLYDRLNSSNFDINQRILSIEFIPLNCILNSYDISNHFIIDCDSFETKQQLMEKPLKFNVNKDSITVELHSYDEDIQREYEKFIKAEKYRELIKNHDVAIKRTSSKK